jgi:predicted outer membrane repeat protein
MLETISRWRSVLTVLALTVLAAPARAEVKKVGAGEQFQKIQDAIDAAIDTVDSVEVKPGTYKEAIDFKGKKIQVTGTGGPSVTIIDGTPATGAPKTAVVTFKTAETPDSILDGFTLTGGTGSITSGSLTAGGGIFIDKSTPTIRNCTISNNTATKGGGIYVQGVGGGGLIVDCTVTGNKATTTSGQAGGGIAVVYAGTDSPVLTIKDCTFDKNLATSVSTGILGGGGYLGGTNLKAKVVLNGTSFTGNTIGTAPTVSGGDGGGLYLDTILIDMQGGEVSGNRALNGGGIAVRNLGVTSSIAGTVVKNNGSITTGGGGGFYFPGSTTSRVTLTGVEISDNTSGSNGGGGMWVAASSPIMQSCKFIGNTTTQDGGAIRYVSSGTKTTVNATVFLNNKAATSGGAVYVSSSSAVPVIYTNCIFVGNSSPTGGGAIHNKAPATASVKFLYCTFYANSGNAGGGAIQFDLSSNTPASAAIANCILWANTPADFPSDTTSAGKISYSDVKIPATFPASRPGMLSLDPAFVDTTADPPNLHLQPTSPLLDKATTTPDPDGPKQDFDGNDRAADSDGNGTEIGDLGAYELVLGPPLPKPKFVRGICRHPDTDISTLDGSQINIGDAIYLLRWKFGGRYPEPGCLKACDADDSGTVDLTDAIYILNYLFVSGKPAPKLPFPALDIDPSSDGLTCLKGPTG